MKFSLKSAILFLLINPLFAQSVLTNAELDNIRNQLEANVPAPTAISLDKIILGNDNDTDDRYFGYGYFNREINFFDNIPTPSDFKLGPGDEITLSMWGETNLREDFIINKSGLIYYKNIGFINLSNKTLKEAELILLEKLSSIYSTLKDTTNQTKLMLDLGKLKSINVYFSGQIQNPGIALIHPFSDIFSAIVQAGGVKKAGSLREVQLIRNGSVLSTVDFYSFFTNGKNDFASIRMLEGDIVHIPVVSKRIEIRGAVITNGYFEILDYESLNNIIESYAGGYKASASSKTILHQVISLSERVSDDNAQSSKVIAMNELADVKLNNGDAIDILSITDVSTVVNIYGRVKSPGSYPAKQTLKEALDLAGGFGELAYRKTILEDQIIILRKDDAQFYSKELIFTYENSGDVELQAGDKIFIYEDINYNNSFTYRLEGHVTKPGTYPLKKGITVGEALKIAGGLTELSTINNLSVIQEFTQLDSNGNPEIISNPVYNITQDFELSNESVLIAHSFHNVIKVEGNVYSPGLIAYEQRMTIANAIELAGGYMPDSIKKKVYLRSANGSIKKVNLFRGRGKVVSPGDTIMVPINENPYDFDVASFTADILTIFANLAAIVFILDNDNSNN